MKRHAVFLLFLVAPLAGAAELFVAPDGDDGNPGSKEAPFRTIQRAIDRAEAGDTVFVRAGIYDQGGSALTIWKESLALKAYPGDARPVIRATLNGPFATVYFEEDNCDGSSIEGFEITGGKHGIQVGSRWNHDLDNGKYPSPVDALTCDDITIQDNIVHDVSREGIKLPAGVRNIVITGNEIYNTGIQGATNAECIDAVGVIGLRVAGNFLHDCASNGIYAKGGSRNVIIENNLVMNVARNTGNGGGIYLGFTTTDYQLFDLPSNPDLYENLDSIVRNNIVVGIKGAGIGLQSTNNARVYNNTLVDVAKNAHAGIRLAVGALCTLQPDDCDPDAADHHRGNVNPHIFNNIVVMTGNRPLLGVEEDAIQIDPGVIAIDHNGYHRMDGDPMFRWNGASVSTLAAWQALSGLDGNSLAGDPGLDEHHHLTLESGLIDMGLAIEGLNIDYDGQVRADGRPDIGADEYSGEFALPVPPPEGVVGTGLGTLLPPDDENPGEPEDPPGDDDGEDDGGNDDGGNDDDGGNGDDDGDGGTKRPSGGGVTGLGLLSALLLAGRRRATRMIAEPPSS